MTAIDGANTTFTYGTSQVTIATVNGRTTTLTLNGSGDLSQITNPDTKVHSFTYAGGSAHELTAETFGTLQNGWAYTDGALADSDATSFWILYDKTSGGILNAYDLGMNSITRDSYIFGRLLGVGVSLNDIISLNSNFSSQAQGLYEASDNPDYRQLLHVESVQKMMPTGAGVC